jgi:hypothetical protein
MRNYPIILLALALTAFLALPASAQSDPAAAATGELIDSSSTSAFSDFEYELILYGWLAGLDGISGVAGMPVAVDVKFSDVLDSLDMVWANTFEIRKGRVGLFTDIMYLGISPSIPGPGPLTTHIEIDQLMFTLLGSYRGLENDRTTIDLLAGGRYIWYEQSIAIPPAPTMSGSESWWDAIGGVRVLHHFTDKVFFDFYGDAGGGSSDHTWQLLGTFGYHLKPNVSLAAGYRYVSYNYQEGGFTYDLDTSGPLLGMMITF